MKKLILPVILVILLAGISGVYYRYNNRATKFSSTPLSCDNSEPKIISLSTTSGTIGTKLEIKGCNLSGFEGDLNAWIENEQGIKGILYGEEGSTHELIKVTLRSPLCQEDVSYKGGPCGSEFNLVPGMYKIYAEPWGNKSNSTTFTIHQ